MYDFVDLGRYTKVRMDDIKMILGPREFDHFFKHLDPKINVIDDTNGKKCNSLLILNSGYCIKLNTHYDTLKSKLNSARFYLSSTYEYD